MNIRNHKVLLTSLIIFVLVLGAALFLLFSFRSGYVEQKRNLQNKSGQLTNLNSRNPFPSSDNLEILQKNADALEKFHQDLLTTLSSGQVEPLNIESAQFPTLLNRAASRIREKARTNNVAIPENFLFGFDLYADGSLPAPANVERLTLQLQMAEALLDMLYESKVKSIMSLERDVFENTTGAESPAVRGFTRGGRPVARDSQIGEQPESDQYTKEPFTLSFSSTDPGLWSVLNNLSSHPMFIVTTHVEMKNPAVPDASDVPLYKGQTPQRNRNNPARSGRRATPAAPLNPFARSAPEPMEPLAGEANEKPKGPLASHEERIVAGRELVEATVKVDIYRVSRPEPENEVNGGGL